MPSDKVLNHCAKYLLFPVTALYCSGLVGCGSDPTMAPVEGIVLLDGKPLDHGMVTFVPAAGRGAKGSIGSDGRFVLGTHSDADGALVGRHRVAVTAFEKPVWPPNYDRDGQESDKSPVPPRYASPDSSGLTFQVEQGRNEAKIELTSK